jgi:hypothetical protein
MLLKKRLLVEKKINLVDFHRTQRRTREKKVMEYDWSSAKSKISAVLTVSWERLILGKQTLFPVLGEKEDKKAKKGAPSTDSEELYTLRATKGVNMHPYLTIILTSDGQKYVDEEEIRLSLVSTADKLPPEIGILYN